MSAYFGDWTCVLTHTVVHLRSSSIYMSSLITVRYHSNTPLAVYGQLLQNWLLIGGRTASKASKVTKFASIPLIKCLTYPQC